MYAKIGKFFEFEAAHFLPNHDGKCRNLHGHTYRLEVEVYGEVSAIRGKTDDGMVIDFGVVSKLVKTDIIEKFDHQLLNDFFQCPTAETLAAYVWRTIAPNLPPNIFLSRVRLFETSNSYAEIGPADALS